MAADPHNDRIDLVMSKPAFERFAEALDAPAEAVPEMVEMFRLPRIPEGMLEQAKRPADCGHDDLDWFVGSAPSGSRHEEDAAQTWLDSLPVKR